jgi:hypothetical protein
MMHWSRACRRGWRRYRSLIGADGVALVEAVWRLLVVDAKLRRGGFQQVIDRTQLRAPEQTNAGDIGEVCRAARYAGLLEIASRIPFLRARCLHRSLALYLWLQGEGMTSELRIGVRKDGGALRAHAWVEIAGQVVNDRPAAVGEFTPLFSTGADRTLTDGAAKVNAWSPAWS